MIFRGTFEHSLDAKHRLTVPAKYRAELAGGVVLALSPPAVPGAPKTISIWTPAGYDSYAQTALAGVHPLSPRARDLHHVLYGNSWELELDSANRLMIPGPALAFANLTKDVTITGGGDRLEVWDRAVYASHNEDVLARYHEIAESFDHTA